MLIGARISRDKAWRETEVLGDDENGSDDVVVFGGGDGRSEGMMRGVWQGWPVISIRMAHQALLRSNRFGVTVTSFSG